MRSRRARKCRRYTTILRASAVYAQRFMRMSSRVPRSGARQASVRRGVGHVYAVEIATSSSPCHKALFDVVELSQS